MARRFSGLSSLRSDKISAGVNSGIGSPNASTSAATSAPPAYSPSNPSFASISLQGNDEIRFLQFPESDFERLHALVAASWSEGIQAVRNRDESTEIKLKGYPWGYSHSGNGPARRLIRLLLEGLYNMGWLLDANVRISRTDDKGTLLFRKHIHQPPPPPCEWFTICCDRDDILTVQCAPPEFLETLSQRLADWTTKTAVEDSRTQIVLKGHPWTARPKHTVRVGLIFLAIREVLEQHRSQIYANVAMIGHPGYMETGLLVCNRAVGMSS